MLNTKEPLIHSADFSAEALPARRVGRYFQNDERKKTVNYLAKWFIIEGDYDKAFCR